MYKCLSCGKSISLEQSKERIRCPFCGFRIMVKERPKTAKTVKAI